MRSLVEIHNNCEVSQGNCSTIKGRIEPGGYRYKQALDKQACNIIFGNGLYGVEAAAVCGDSCHAIQYAITWFIENS